MHLLKGEWGCSTMIEVSSTAQARFDTDIASGDLFGTDVNGMQVWSGTPIRDISCCYHPLTGVPYLRPGP